MKVRFLSISPLLLASPLFASVGTDNVAPSLSAIIAPGQPSQVYDRSVNHFPVLQLTAADNLAGVQYLMATFAPIGADGEFSGSNEITVHALAERSLLTGSPQSGTFSMECRIPRGSVEGNYQLRAIKIADASGNIADYAADGSAPALPISAPFTFSVAGADAPVLPTAGDAIAPALTSVSIMPGQLGVAANAGFFNIALGVSDDISGIEAAEVWLVSPSGIFLCLSATGGEAVISGNEKSGTLHLRGRIPAGAEAGLWRVARVGLRDRTGKTSLTGWEPGTELASTSLLVYTTDGDGDGHLEYDLFPSDSTEWADHDLDGTGDNADADDDNDGLPDAWEVANGMNPKDASDASTDGDGDQLSALAEYLTGTRPNTLDSDADGIADGDEGPVYGTNPGNHDSDGDGFLDGTEVAEGFSPAEPGNRPPFKATGALETEGFNLRFVSRIGSSYRIECTANFERWDIVEEGIPGDGRPLFHLLPRVAPEGGFYRVVETSPVGP